jgi:hypothetical protein
MADVAGAAAKARDAGLSANETIERIEKQMPDEPRQQVSHIVFDIYGEGQPTADESSNKMLQSCFDPE